MRMSGRGLLVLMAGLALAGCAHVTAPVGRAHVAAPGPALAAARLAPEQAEERARKKAQEWRADAKLIGVVWAVPRLELSSVVYHVFRGGKADELCAIETKLTTWWQTPRVIADRKLALAAQALAEVEHWPVDAKRALTIAKAQLPAGHGKPVALLALGRARLAPPLWGVKADDAEVLIHAASGKVLVGAAGQPAALLRSIVETADPSPTADFR